MMRGGAERFAPLSFVNRANAVKTIDSLRSNARARGRIGARMAISALAGLACASALAARSFRSSNGWPLSSLAMAFLHQNGNLPYDGLIDTNYQRG